MIALWLLGAAYAAPTFEYCSITVTFARTKAPNVTASCVEHLDTNVTTLDALNQLGAAGWHLVAVEPSSLTRSATESEATGSPHQTFWLERER